MIVDQIRFYGDTASHKNKLYIFKINSIFDLEASLKRFMQTFYIRAAWLQTVEDGVVISNERIDLVTFLDYNTVQFSVPAAEYCAQVFHPSL